MQHQRLERPKISQDLRFKSQSYVTSTLKNAKLCKRKLCKLYKNAKLGIETGHSAHSPQILT